MTPPTVSSIEADPHIADSDTTAPEHPRRHRLRQVAVPLVIAALVVAGFLSIEPVTVGSDSMSPTLVQGQRVIVDKLTYHLRSPHRNELVMFRAPDTGDLTLKRVVGVAGDTVAIRDGVLTVNRQAQHEPYVNQAEVDSVYFGPVTVPTGTVFVMGDNRANSIDSRTFGPVPIGDVIGRVLWKL